eukprot:1182520-Prorocentrum_minimum.AAC.3
MPLSQCKSARLLSTKHRRSPQDRSFVVATNTWPRGTSGQTQPSRKRPDTFQSVPVPLPMGGFQLQWFYHRGRARAGDLHPRPPERDGGPTRFLRQDQPERMLRVLGWHGHARVPR